MTDSQPQICSWTGAKGALNQMGKPNPHKSTQSMAGADDRTANYGRHAPECRICSHPRREDIERDFVNWRSAAGIAKQYGLRNRSTVYRHAHAAGLFPKRQRNARAALEKIIERAGEVEVTASAVVAAVQAYSKINALGQWIDRSEHVNLNELFERMTVQEMEEYARDGALPAWFKGAVSATVSNGREG